MIPDEIITAMEADLEGLTHGVVTVQVHVRDGHLVRFVVSRERSVIPAIPAKMRKGARYDPE